MSVKCQETEIDDIVRRHNMYANDQLQNTTPSDKTKNTTTPNNTQADKNTHINTAPIYKFALTGGPCGGKTTALERISSYLRERGFEVFTVPEAMTILCSNGFSKEEYFKVDGMPYYVQHSIMDLQTSLEDSFERVLRASGKKGVILCDRGLMDGSAYMDPEGWDKLMEERGVSSAEIREGRYNAVFHLVTSAEGAEEFYSLENNAARCESPQEARATDLLTRKAWLGHQNLRVFDNSTDFETKLRNIVAAISKLVGLPTTMKNKTVKYLLRKTPDLAAFPEDVHYYIFDVEKVYLYNIDSNSASTSTDSNFIEEYSFIRKRSHISLQGKELGTTYGITTARILHDGNNIEVKRIISSREYRAAYHARDTSRHIVKQRRISFLYKTQSFNIHIYKEPIENMCIVNAQAASVDDVDQCHNGESNGNAIDFPPFLDLERRLENNKEDEEKFGSFNISLMND